MLGALGWASGKGSLPDKPTGKPEASAWVGRGAGSLWPTLWEGCCPGEPQSLPEGQVVVGPLPPREGIAFPPPSQIGFHVHPKLVRHPAAGSLHPPGSPAQRGKPRGFLPMPAHFGSASSRQSTFFHPFAFGLQLSSVWVQWGWETLCTSVSSSEKQTC